SGYGPAEWSRSRSIRRPRSQNGVRSAAVAPTVRAPSTVITTGTVGLYRPVGSLGRVRGGEEPRAGELVEEAVQLGGRLRLGDIVGLGQVLHDLGVRVAALEGLPDEGGGAVQPEVLLAVHIEEHRLVLEVGRQHGF